MFGEDRQIVLKDIVTHKANRIGGEDVKFSESLLNVKTPCAEKGMAVTGRADLEDLARLAGLQVE
jgi:hypothetical protein